MTTVTVLDNPGVNYCAFVVSPVFPTCPVTGEPYAADVTVQYKPALRVIEYIAFEEWVHNLTTHQPSDPEELTGMTLEDLACVVLARVRVLLEDDRPVRVVASILASAHCRATVEASNNWRDNG